jgi:hypothetical protein
MTVRMVSALILAASCGAMLDGCNGVVTVAASGSTAAASASTAAATSSTAVASAQPSAGTVTVSWTAPTQNTDGTPMTDLVGFHIYYGPAATELINVIAVDGAGTLSYAIGDLSPGTWYIAVAAYNSEDIESRLSGTVPVTLPM